LPRGPSARRKQRSDRENKARIAASDLRASRKLRVIFDRLSTAYGPQHWWPAETPTEVAIGAILTQNTAWKNVERAIANLKAADCLNWKSLCDISEQGLAKLIRPSGTFRVKAFRLKSFVTELWEKHRGSLEAMLDGDVEVARKRLLEIHGIGPETADAILLYAGQRPSFVVDAYTRRVLRRHFLIDGEPSYDAIRQLFHRSLPADSRLFNEYHALLVTVGKRHCRSRATCEGCPLADLRHNDTI
jgi:endonuclease-3 related protein